MAAKLSITFGAGFSFLLGAFWIMAVALPWNWCRADNAIVSFEVNLWNVYTHAGLGTSIVKGIGSMLGSGVAKFTDEITKFIDGQMSIADAKQTFCVISIFNWCDQWEKLFWASWIMSILGSIAAALFIAGGACLYFYGNVHATETGRCMSKFFLMMGPLCGLSGIVAYSVLTMDFGKSTDPIMSTGSHAYWGTGWIVGITVTVLSWIPVYILLMFCSADPNEKKHGDGEDDYLDYGDGGAANFQAPAQGGATGYGAAGYGMQGQAQPMPQAVPHGYPASNGGGYGMPASAPVVYQQAPANAPGYGAPAW